MPTVKLVGTDATVSMARSAEYLRRWLIKVVASDPRSIHAIEVAADVRGNALGKFLRGERGRRGLSPLQLRRLAPVLHVSESELLVRGGHATYNPAQKPLEAAILDESTLDLDARLLLLDIVARLRIGTSTRLELPSSNASPPSSLAAGSRNRRALPQEPSVKQSSKRIAETRSSQFGISDAPTDYPPGRPRDEEYGLQRGQAEQAADQFAVERAGGGAPNRDEREVLAPRDRRSPRRDASPWDGHSGKRI
jgi:hypothetical protein